MGTEARRTEGQREGQQTIFPGTHAARPPEKEREQAAGTSQWE